MILVLSGLAFAVSSHRDSLSRDLGQAADVGDVDRVSSLLRWRWYFDVDRRGALGRAAEAGHTVVVALLLEAGATADDFDLARAAQEGHTEVVAQLIEAGVDVSLSYRALTRAAGWGHLETVQLLLDAGAKVNQGPYVGARSRLGAAVSNFLNETYYGPASSRRVHETDGTPTYYPAALHVAIKSGHTDIAALLIEAGANVLEPDFGTNAVELAVEGGQPEMIELLEAAVDLPMAVNVINAAQRGEWDRLLRVVALGAAVNEPERSNEPTTAGWTALMYAARAGRADVVSIMLDRGADVDYSDASSETALSLAVAHGHADVAELLRSAGDDGG